MNELLDEARQMPNASVRFAGGIDQVWTPEHLIPLRTRVRSECRAELLAVHAEINKRFGTTGASDDYVNVFYAASEMALMERVARDELPTEDRVALRRLWGDLLFGGVGPQADNGAARRRLRARSPIEADAAGTGALVREHRARGYE